MDSNNKRFIFIFVILLLGLILYYYFGLKSFVGILCGWYIRYRFNRFFVRLTLSKEVVDAMDDTSVDFKNLTPKIKTSILENNYCRVVFEKSNKIVCEEKMTNEKSEYRILTIPNSYKIKDLWGLLCETFTDETVYYNIIQACKLMGHEYDECFKKRANYNKISVEPESKDISEDVKTEPLMPVLKVDFNESKLNNEPENKHSGERQIDL